MLLYIIINFNKHFQTVKFRFKLLTFLHVQISTCACFHSKPQCHIMERSVPKQVLSCSFIQTCSFIHMSLEPAKFTHGTGEAPSVILQYIWCNATIKVQNTKSLKKTKCSLRISCSSSIWRCPVVKLNMLFTQRNVVSCS